MQTKVLNLEGIEVGKVSLNEKVFGAEYNEDLNALFKIALNDPDRSVRETAKAASDRLNRA